MIIDMHCHYLSSALDAALRERDIAPCIETLADGIELLHLPVGALGYGTDFTDMDARLAFMEANGIERQLLSFPGLFGIDSLPADEAEAFLLPFNDNVSALCKKTPDRFTGLAALPFADMDRAVAEYHRARTELWLAGAILPVNGFLTLEHAEYFHPIFAVAEEHGSHLFIHPGRRPDQMPAVPVAPRAAPAPYADSMVTRQALDVQTAVASTMVTLSLTDFLKPYQGVTIQVANLGGTLSVVVERMDHATRIRSPGETPPSERLGGIYVDCASLGPRAIEAAVAVYGADRVMLGTDCPIFRTDWTLEAVRAANIGDEARKKILSLNAKALLCV